MILAPIPAMILPAILSAFLSLAPPTAPTPEASPVKTPLPRLSKSGYDLTPLTPEQIAAIRKTLTTEEDKICFSAETERPFCGTLLDNKKDGIYVCVAGGLPLFASSAKFNSGTGWPSFFAPFDPDHIIEKVDRSHGMVRTEILDARSGAHLGHVFDDGPPPTGKRYCLNSAALKFIAKGEPLPPESQPAVAYFAGGCFWGVEDRFAQVPGVIDAESGYAGGSVLNPTYKAVCSGDTGHAEVVRVMFDPKKVSYEQLVRFFFKIHDPTTLNRQGPDIGTQYRSAIYVMNDDQRRVTDAVIASLTGEKAFKGRKIVTEVAPYSNYFAAEEYHQDYHKKHGGSCAIPTP
jgi:peptide methionine sulfoxide reductase msrA/msrB